MIKAIAPEEPPQLHPLNIGQERDWVWRGWQTRYTFMKPQGPLRLTQVQSRSESPSRPSLSTPLILLHGFGAAIGHWRHNISVLAEQHPVYAFDLVGFGASQKPKAEYNAYFWAEQAYQFWRQLINVPVVLVGNSIGSLIALTIAKKYPEMVAGLVLLSLPDPAVRQELIPAAIAPLMESVERFFTSDWLLRPLFYLIRRPAIVRPWAGLAYADPKNVDDQLLEILLTPACDTDADRAFVQIIGSMTQVSFGPSVKETLTELSVPILLIWGQQDRLIPPRFGPEFCRHSSTLKLLELDNAGHCPQDEQPDIVNREILTWMAQQGLDYLEPT